MGWKGRLSGRPRTLGGAGRKGMQSSSSSCFVLPSRGTLIFTGTFVRGGGSRDWLDADPPTPCKPSKARRSKDEVPTLSATMIRHL